MLQELADIDTDSVTPAAGNTSTAAAENVDEDVLPVVIDRDMTIEEVASGFGRSLDEVKRLNPNYKPGEKIKSQSTVILPFF